MNFVVQQLSIDGKQYVLLPQSEYDKLRDRAGVEAELTEEGLPPLPKPDKKGRFPAEEYAKISLARDIIRGRRQSRLSQQQLADLAGIRQETLSRIETGKHKASIRTVEKIELALSRAVSKSR